MITSVVNSKIKRVVELNQKAKMRRKENIFMAEGSKMFLEAPKERIRDVFVSESFYLKCDELCLDRLAECGYELVSDEVYKKLSDTQTPQGILCLVEQMFYTLEDMEVKKAPLIVMLEDIQDPGNLGTIMRTGEGAGIDGIIMSRGTVDIYNPKTIRATMGSIYRVPFLYVDKLSDTMRLLQDKGIHIYAAHLEGKNYYDSYSFASGTAFLIGNEGNGLRKETADGADSYIKIPMEGQVESLNAGVAASLLIYEAKRQRRQVGD